LQVLTKERLAYRAARSDSQNDLMFSHVELLVAMANRSLHEPLISVMDKLSVPPSGDKHDYYRCA
jgi:hypothetical protein